MNKKDATAPASETGSGRELPDAIGRWWRGEDLWLVYDTGFARYAARTTRDGTVQLPRLCEDLPKGGWQPAVAGGEGDVERQTTRHALRTLREALQCYRDLADSYGCPENESQHAWIEKQLQRAEASAAALAEARGEIERLKHRLTSYEAIETRAEQLLDPTFRWQHCEALFDLVDEFGKLRERLAGVEAEVKKREGFIKYISFDAMKGVDGDSQHDWKREMYLACMSDGSAPLLREIESQSNMTWSEDDTTAASAAQSEEQTDAR